MARGWSLLSPMETSIHCPSHMSTHAPARRETRVARVSAGRAHPDSVLYAREKRVSPASMASEAPYFLCVVGTPCLVSSLSMMSSCTSEKLWIISTAPAAAMASSAVPSIIWHVCIRRYGRSLLPPWTIKWLAAS